MEKRNLRKERIGIVTSDKMDKSVVKDLMIWAEKISKLPKETQKQFLVFSLGLFRKSMLSNYKSITYGNRCPCRWCV